MRWDQLSGGQRMALEAIAQDVQLSDPTSAAVELRDRILNMADEIKKEASVEEGDVRTAIEYCADVCQAVEDLKDTVKEEFSQWGDEDVEAWLRGMVDELDARGWTLVPPSGQKHRCSTCTCAKPRVQRVPRVRKLAVVG